MRIHGRAGNSQVYITALLVSKCTPLCWLRRRDNDSAAPDARESAGKRRVNSDGGYPHLIPLTRGIGQTSDNYKDVHSVSYCANILHERRQRENEPASLQNSNLERSSHSC